MRTQRSRTYKTTTGYQAKIGVDSLNYQDPQGNWQPIDNTLRAVAGGYQNGANQYQATLPATADAPVRVNQAGSWVSFAIAGAAAVQPTVKGTTATYAQVRPGLTLAMATESDTLKEFAFLDSADAASSLLYNVAASPGVTAAVQHDGSVIFTDAGKTVFVFSPPTMRDASQSMTAESKTFQVLLAPSANGWTLQLVPDQTWLTAPGRQFPVIVDPTVTFDKSGSVAGCWFAADAPGASCSDGTWYVGHGNSPTDGYGRAMLQFNDLTSTIPADAVVTNADLKVYTESAFTSTGINVGAYPMTRAWTSGATWATYDGTNNWTTAGGDFGALAASSTMPGTSSTWTHFYPAQLVQSWVNHSTANNGLMLKWVSEVNTYQVFQMTGFLSTNTTNPVLTVDYDRYGNGQSFLTNVTQQLSDKSSAHVNVASGNLQLSSTDLNISGTGISQNVSRYWNSLHLNDTNDMGTGWVNNQGRDLQVVISGSGVKVEGPGMMPMAFLNNGSGGYTAPTGADADLSKRVDGVTYDLTFHQSQEKWTFLDDGSGVGSLQSRTDRNGNVITYSFNGSHTVGIPARAIIDSSSDTQHRTLTANYPGTAGAPLSGFTDNSSRAVTYAYTSGKLTGVTDANSKTTTYTYDGSSRTTQVDDARGNRTKFGYDSSNRVTSMIRVTNLGAGTGPTWSFTYNTFANVSGTWQATTVVTDPNNNSTTYTYDTGDRVTNVADPLGHTRANTWTANSSPATATNAMSAVSNFTYATTHPDNLTQAQAPSTGTGLTANTTQYAYGDTSHPYNVTSSTDAQSNATIYAYDTGGNMNSSSDALSNSTTKTYNTDGTIATVRGAASGASCTATPKVQCTVYAYNWNTSGSTRTTLASLVITNPSPLGSETYTFDSLGRVTQYVDGKSQQTNFTYDPIDRLTKVTYNGDTTCSSWSTCTTYSYDEDGNLTSRHDATGTTGFTFDALNRVTVKTLPSAATVTNAWDAASNLSSYTDPAGTVNYTYDAANRLTALAEPGGSCSGTVSLCTTFTDDNADRRTSTAYPNGVTQHVTYDALGRATAVDATLTTTSPELLPASYADNEGSSAAWPVVSGAATTSNSTDYAKTGTKSFKAVTTNSSAFAVEQAYSDRSPVDHTKTYTVSMWARSSVAKYLDLTVDWYNSSGTYLTYGYVAGGNTSTTGWTQYTATITPPSTAASVDVKVSWASNGSGQTLYLDSGSVKDSTPPATTTLRSYTYNFHPVVGSKDSELMQSWGDGTNTVNYTYNQDNKLTDNSAYINTGHVLYAHDVYGYDANGNQTSHAINGTTTNYTFNQANQLTTTGNSYDANGNQTATPTLTSLSYNSQNQTTSITPSGGSAISNTYADAGQGERTANGSTTFLEGNLGITRSTTSGVSTEWVRDNRGVPISRISSNHYYYIFDGRGNVTDIVDNSGSFVTQYSYDPYGQTTASSGSMSDPWRYNAGYQDDSTKLYKYGSRYYNPAQPIWTQQDPIGGSLTQPQTWNRYPYAGDDPINHADVSGKDWLDDAGNAAGDFINGANDIARKINDKLTSCSGYLFDVSVAAGIALSLAPFTLGTSLVVGGITAFGLFALDAAVC